jgi:23S rRNA pseudouridine1911/1915/1917 synthase
MSSSSRSDANPPDAPAPAPTVHSINAGADAAGQRADRFLADAIGSLSRTRVKALIETGHVSRDGIAFKEPAEPIRPGACYRLAVPAPVPALPQPETIAFPILYEDADLLVLDKPAGLVVHPAPGNETGTLVNALLAHCGDQLPGIGGERRPGIVHRLDKETSGLMVVAKSEQALAALSAAFATRNLDRAYLALCWGLPNPAEGTIEGAIGRDPRERKRMTIVAHGGKPALTRYRTLASHQAAVALLECRLATGRTHQIRVHLASRGHPIVGDPVYLRRIPAAARALPEALRRTLLDFPRQALHAARLGFVHPRTGQRLAFTTPPPPDMQHLLTLMDMEQT